jgi:nitrate/nitrite sensing protein
VPTGPGSRQLSRALREQITAHLDDALGPGAGDEEVAATLRRLGPPADLAAEAGAASASWSAPGPQRARWRLAVLVAVPVITAAVLGALRIGSDVGNVAAAGRDQRLVQLNAAVVTYTRDLEDERDLSGAYAARRQDRPAPSLATLARARTATDAAAATVRADAAGIGVGAGYQPKAVQDMEAILAGITDLRHRHADPAARASGLGPAGPSAP